MSESDKMQAVAVEMAKKIAEELMSTQVKLFQDEMKKMQDEGRIEQEGWWCNKWQEWY